MTSYAAINHTEQPVIARRRGVEAPNNLNIYNLTLLDDWELELATRTERRDNGCFCPGSRTVWSANICCVLGSFDTHVERASVPFRRGRACHGRAGNFQLNQQSG